MPHAASHAAQWGKAGQGKSAATLGKGWGRMWNLTLLLDTYLPTSTPVSLHLLIYLLDV